MSNAIRQSEPAIEVWRGILALQTDGVLVQHDSKNPQLSNSYTSLEGVMRAVSPVLVRAGCLITQPVSFDDGRVVVTTRIVHAETGQWVEATAEAKPAASNRGTNDLQMAGVAISYLRRYALLSMLGLATTDDSDGAVVGVVELPDWVEKGCGALKAANVEFRFVETFIGLPETWASSHGIEGARALVVRLLGAHKRGPIVGFAKSESGNGSYILTAPGGVPTCDCKSYETSKRDTLHEGGHKSKTCKHLRNAGKLPPLAAGDEAPAADKAVA